MATMHTLGDTADRRPALSADSLCEAALAAFIRDPDCRTLTVVEDEKPVAMIHREAFLARMEARGAASKPILEVAEPDPLVGEAGEGVDAFVERAMAERPRRGAVRLHRRRQGRLPGRLRPWPPAAGDARRGPAFHA